MPAHQTETREAPPGEEEEKSVSKADITSNALTTANIRMERELWCLGSLCRTQ